MTKEQAYKILGEHGMKHITIEYCVKENGKLLTGIMGMQYNILEQDIPTIMNIVKPFNKEVHKLANKIWILNNPFPDADFVDCVSPNESYDPEKLIKRATQKVPKELPTTKKDFGTYQEIIETQKRTIRNLWWAFGLMFAAWIIMSIAYITK